MVPAAAARRAAGGGGRRRCPGGSSATPRQIRPRARHRRSRGGRGGQLCGQASRRGGFSCGSRSAGAEWGQVPPASPGGGGGSRGLRWRPARGALEAAGVTWRPAREALEAAGVRRCAQSSQLHEAEFGARALGGLENSGLAGGRQAGVLLACGAAGRGGCTSTLAEALARGREPCGARCAADGPVPRSGGVLLEERGT